MAYYARKPLDDTRVICDPCGTKRWGDPFGDDDGKAAFDARCADPDDWCWTPRWSMSQTPCTDCGNDAEAEPDGGWEPRVTDEFVWINCSSHRAHDKIARVLGRKPEDFFTMPSFRHYLRVPSAFASQIRPITGARVLRRQPAPKMYRSL